MKYFEQAINALVIHVHEANIEAGWREKDGPVDFPMSVALMHSELSEALEADRKGLMDDHLPERDGREVELVDLLIRLFDTAGAMKMDLGGAFIEKLAYNKTRADHKLENRVKDGGKKY